MKMANPYGVQYGQGGYQQQKELLPNFRQTPPPEVLRAQANNQAQEFFNDYVSPAAKFLGAQFLENAAITGLTGKSLGQWALQGGRNFLNSPSTLATIATLQATRAGEPLIRGVTRFAESPLGQKAGKATEKLINWIF